MTSPASVFVLGLLLNLSCGFRLNGRIIGGEPADINDYPYQLSLEYDYRHVCGASILTETVALTAAHCTDGRPNSFAVRAGSSTEGFGGQLVRVSEVKQHPKYSPRQNDYDVSILLLVKPLEKGAAIALQQIGEEVEVGTFATIAGWGATAEGGSVTSQLQKVDLARVSDDACGAAYGHITSRMICFAAPKKDSCQGDSGGPLVYDKRQIGIVSFGVGCARPEYPGVYAKISNSEIYSFIEENLK